MIEVLQSQLIPWVGTGSPIVLLDAPPRVIGANKVTENPGKKLALNHGTGQTVQVQDWPEENLDSATIPMLGCIIEGEADLLVGTTTAMCQRLKIEGKKWVVQMPQRSFFVAPPGVPISSVWHVHWQRPNPEKAYSRMLWVQIHESGVYCHFNTSDKGRLWVSPHIFLKSRHIFPLVSNLIQEMQNGSKRYVPISYFYMGLILEYVLQNLLEPPPLQDAVLDPMPLPLPQGQPSVDERIIRAIDFINEHFDKPELTVDAVAASVHLSSAHLRRMFQQELSISVAQFLTKKRLEFARQLLLESSFNIKQVSVYAGYKYPANFTHAFAQHFGVSPTAFRHNTISDVRKS